MVLVGLSSDELAAFVRRSCAAQGVEVFVTDAGVMDRVGALLGAATAGSGHSAAEGGAVSSESPDDLGPVGVEGLGTGGSGSDHDVVNDGGDDGGLAGEVEVRPPAA